MPVEGPESPLFALEVCFNVCFCSLCFFFLGGIFFSLKKLSFNFIAMQQINPEKAREEFRSASQANGGTGVKDFMDGMGLGMLVEQVSCCSIMCTF